MNDDLTPFQDEPLLSALRAPASPAELAGEQDALAMFRAVSARPRRRRAVRRLGVGGAGVVLGLTLTGGVAAAYTTGLPDPVQNAVHAAIAPLPLPAPPDAPTRHRAALRRHLRQQLGLSVRPRRRDGASGAPPTSPAPTSGAQPAPAPVPRPHRSAQASPTPAASPQASTSPQPAPTWSVAVSRRTVPVHSTVVLTGRLTRGGSALAGRRVHAAEQLVGEAGWHRVAAGRTGSDGRVALTIPALTRNVRLRLVTDTGAVSAALPVAVVPKLAVSKAAAGRQRTVTVSADGGEPGDRLVLLRLDGSSWTQVATTTLDSAGTGQFTVPGPAKQQVRYRVRLARTARHAVSVAGFTIAAR